MKKIVNVLLIIVALFIININEIKASTLKVDITKTDYGRKYEDNYMSSGGRKGHFFTFSIENKTAYCIEPDIDTNKLGEYYKSTTPDHKLTSTTIRKLSLIAYFGYDYPNHQTMNYKMATQQLIWETAAADPSYSDRNFNFINFYETDLTTVRNVKAEYNEILRLVEKNMKYPSFNRTTINANIGETITFEDSNKVLETGFVPDKLTDCGNGKATCSISGNTFSVTPNVNGKIVVGVIKEFNQYNDNSIFYNSGEYQDLMTAGSITDIPDEIVINVTGGKVGLEKLDSKTLSFKPTGDASLANATYGIYDTNDHRISGITTTGNSIVMSDELPKLGRYYLKEEKSGTGYELDDQTKYYFEITKDNLNPIVTVYENVIEKEFELYKMFSDGGQSMILKSEPNVTFEFYLESSSELYVSATTDQNGRFLVKLPYGIFIVHQKTTTPNHEKLQDFRVIIDEKAEDRITKIATNADLTAKLKLIKVDENSKRMIVQDGIKFKIKNLDTNQYICQNITYPTQQKVCVFETTDGFFVTPSALSSGNYQIEELENQSINGYLWNPVPMKFTISDDSNFIYDDEFGIMLEIQFENKQVKAEFELTKIGEKMVVENGNFRYEEIELTGIAFDLYANEDIYSSDGTLIHHNKDLIKSFVLDHSNYKISDLYLGKYCLVETSTADNHVLNPTPYCFELKYVDQYTPIVSKNIVLKNYLIKGDFELSKIDFSNGNPVAGALIEIYNENNELIFSGRSDSDKGIVVKNLSIGRYKYVEVEAPDGYSIDSKEHFFEIKENGEIIKLDLTNVKVPDTLLNDSKILDIASVLIILAGIGFIFYDKKKKK